MSPLTLEQLARIFKAGANAVPGANTLAGDALWIALNAMRAEALKILEEENGWDEENT